MTVHYEILPDMQRVLLPGFAPLQRLGYVLYGGTAIALQLGHRSSIDFDFFSDRPMDRAALVGALPLLGDALVVQDEISTWTVLVGSTDAPVKVSFFAGLGFGRVGRPTVIDEGILLASLDDLLGHKLKVLPQRVEAKDCQDIAAMLDAGQALERGLGAARALFANFPPCEAVKALVYFDDSDLAALSSRDRSILAAHVDRLRTPTRAEIRSKRLGLTR